MPPTWPHRPVVKPRGIDVRFAVFHPGICPTPGSRRQVQASFFIFSTANRGEAMGNRNRRSFLRSLLALPMGALVSSGWWFRSADTVVVRGGWVLSKAD